MKMIYTKYWHEQFGEIRILIDEKKEPWFMGKDVAKALGYVNPSNALQVHVDEEDKTTYLNQVSGSNYKTKTMFVNESGLYSLILSSKLPQAKAFKRWATSEVLPKIRKTGGYIPTKDAEGNALTTEEIVRKAETIVNNTLITLNTPNDNCLTSTQVAAVWGLETKEFNKLLKSAGIIHREDGRWQLSEDLQGMGLTKDRHFFCYSLHGEPRTKSYLVWTPEGVDFLNGHVKQLQLVLY